MGIIGESKSDDNIKEEIQILATNMEVLNQRLTVSSIGDDPVLKQHLNQVLYQINYLYKTLTTIEKSFDQRMEKGFNWVSDYLAGIDQRMEVLVDATNKLYKINEQELAKINENLKIFEKIVSEDKVLWAKLNDIKKQMITAKKSNDNIQERFAQDISKLKGSVDIYSDKINQIKTIVERE